MYLYVSLTDECRFILSGNTLCGETKIKNQWFLCGNDDENLVIVIMDKVLIYFMLYSNYSIVFIIYIFLVVFSIMIIIMC